jgi:hypothetical protein
MAARPQQDNKSSNQGSDRKAKSLSQQLHDMVNNEFILAHSLAPDPITPQQYWRVDVLWPTHGD